MARKLMCEMGPVFYRISVEKEVLRRKLKDLVSRERFAGTVSALLLPEVAASHSSVVLRRLEGVDMRLQENKAVNLQLACDRLNGLVIAPGETFSFWRTVGRPTAKKGYLEGLFIGRQGLGSGVGGGLCQMGNMIHLLVLHSPLTVTELHHHTDALFPDDRRRVPFGTGTSVSYNNVDYRFKNETGEAVQLHLWIEDGELRGEIRSARPFPYRYELQEENHRFCKEDGVWYRRSQVYRLVYDAVTGEQLRKELLLDNRSRVMYDPALIPQDQIRDS